MRIQENRASDVRIAYLGGGSCGWAWRLMGDLALEEQMSGTVCLYDIDEDSARKNQLIGNGITAREDAKAKWNYTVAKTLEEALTGADFVLISILPGTFDEMESDVHEPERHGIFQSVGDTVGPGGLLRALRTLPIFEQFAHAIRDCCPDAWVINYTNPMTVCVRSLYRAFPEIKAFGCCHEVFGTQELLASMLKKYHGIDAKRHDISVNVLGINHFTWLTSAWYQDINLFPLYQRLVDEWYETGFTKNDDISWRTNPFASPHRVKFDLFRRYGWIAAAGDRHLAEFCPGKWYLASLEMADEWRFGLTTIPWRRENQKNRIKRREQILSGEQILPLESSGEEGHLLMKALLGLGDFVSNVNLPNNGQITNLPMDAVVETNAVFRRNSVNAVASGAVPHNLLGLLQRQVCNQEMAVCAALHCDYGLAYSVLVNDPLCTTDLNSAKQMLDKMLANTSTYLPAKWHCAMKNG